MQGFETIKPRALEISIKIMSSKLGNSDLKDRAPYIWNPGTKDTLQPLSVYEFRQHFQQKG
jgi:hypothetical protein